MKQIVNFEQAKRLEDADICIHTKEVVNNNGHYMSADEFTCTSYCFAPTIGELIEWITDMEVDIEIQCSVLGYRIQMLCYPYEEIKIKTELLDALVELAIKIKESE